MSSTTFIQKVHNLSINPRPLQTYTSRPSFPEFYSSFFPIFSLYPSVSKPDLIQAITSINQQACSELSFSPEELDEAGLAAALPTPWDMSSMDAVEAVRWYLESFDKIANGHGDENEEPKWYPLGFIGIDDMEWQENERGVLLIYFDVTGQGTEDESVTVHAFRVDAKKIGAAVISLRQGDDEVGNVRRWCGVDPSLVSSSAWSPSPAQVAQV